MNYQTPAYSNAAYPHNVAGSSSLADFAGMKAVTHQEVPLPLPGPSEPHLPAASTTTASTSHSNHLKVNVDVGRILKTFHLQPAIDQLVHIFGDRQLALAAAMLYLKFGLTVRRVRIPTMVYSDHAKLIPGSIQVPAASLHMLSILCAQDPIPGFAAIAANHGKGVSNNVFLSPEGVMYARCLILKLNKNELRHRDPAAVERGTAALQRYMDDRQLLVDVGSAANQRPLSTAGTLPVPWKLASLRRSHPEAERHSLPAEHSVARPVVYGTSIQQSQGDRRKVNEGQVWEDCGARDPGTVQQHSTSTSANPFSGATPSYITSQTVTHATRSGEVDWSSGAAMNVSYGRYIPEGPQPSYTSSPLAGALVDSNARGSEFAGAAASSQGSSDTASWCTPSATMYDNIGHTPYGNAASADAMELGNTSKRESFLSMLYADDIPEAQSGHSAVTQAILGLRKHPVPLNPLWSLDTV